MVTLKVNKLHKKFMNYKNNKEKVKRIEIFLRKNPKNENSLATDFLCEGATDTE